MDIDLADLPDNVETLQRMVRTLATERANLTEARAEIERELWWLHAREANFKARELLQHAIELDPDFAPAYAFLAAAHINDYVSQWGASPSQSLEKAHEVVMRAAALDDKYPYTYWGMTFVNLWMRRYDDAVRAAERSISLNPNFAEGHNALALSCIMLADPRRLSDVSTGQWRWIHFVPVCGCTFRRRRPFNWAGTKRPPLC